MSRVDLPALVQLKNMQKEYDSYVRKVDELLNQKTSRKLPLQHNPLFKIDEDEIKQLYLLMKNVNINQISLEKECQTLKQNIKKLESQIEEAQKELDKASEEYQQIKAEQKETLKLSKIYDIVIKKYFTKFNMLIDIKRNLDEDTFIASVKLPNENDSETDKLMNLIVNRKTRTVIDFDLPLKKEEELRKIKKKVLCDDVVNLKLLLTWFKYLS